jgi:SNF2 family DNA or RNA helicase
METGRGGLSPFVHKLTLSDLWKDASLNRSFCMGLQQCGMNRPPFELKGDILHHRGWIQLINTNPFNYLRLSSKGSIRKTGICPLSPAFLKIPVGQLRSGELYIDNPAQWYKNIQVRFRYQGALTSFYPFYNEIPYLTDQEEWRLRDESSETSWLGTLSETLDADGCIQLKEADTTTLKQWTDQGWKLYVARSEGGHSRAYAHSVPSGIVWFSTKEKEDDKVTSNLLDAFLNGRNYHESDGNIQLFQKKDGEKLSQDEIIGEISPSTDVWSLYRSNKRLVDSDFLEVKQQIKKYFRGDLRSYQWDGVKWLLEQRMNHHGCLLADDMGLGKTVQVIAYLLTRPHNAQHLIIAPVSLLTNWMNEIHRFAPILEDQITQSSYDHLRLHQEDYSQEYDTIIIDEAQYIKNRDTKNYRSVRKLRGQHIIYLTGTPIENSVEEIWTHFMVLNPSLAILHEQIRKLTENIQTEEYARLSGLLLSPFILSRNKKDVLTELPDKVERTLYVELDETERNTYRRIHQMVVHSLAEGITGRLNSMVLEGLLRLRMCCVSTNILPDYLNLGNIPISSKMYLALEYVLKCQRDGERVLVFSQFVVALQEFARILKQKSLKYVELTGETHNRQEVIQRFQNDTTIPVFLLSLKAGGVGLNLTAANHVLFLDDWWNPAVESQAMDRAHRMGQPHTVWVTRLVCKDTIEEKILLLQQRKKEQVDTFNMNQHRLTMDEIKGLLE